MHFLVAREQFYEAKRECQDVENYSAARKEPGRGSIIGMIFLVSLVFAIMNYAIRVILFNELPGYLARKMPERTIDQVGLDTLRIIYSYIYKTALKPLVCFCSLFMHTRSKSPKEFDILGFPRWLKALRFCARDHLKKM